jgi:hypothetical protein
LLEGRITESKIEVRKQRPFWSEFWRKDKYYQRLFQAVVESDGTGTLMRGRFRLPLGQQLAFAFDTAICLSFLIAALGFASATLVGLFKGGTIAGDQLINLAMFCLVAALVPLLHFNRFLLAGRASEEVLTVISDTVEATRVSTNA